MVCVKRVVHPSPLDLIIITPFGVGVKLPVDAHVPGDNVALMLGGVYARSVHVSAGEEEHIALLDVWGNALGVSGKRVRGEVVEGCCFVFARDKLNVLTCRDLTKTVSVCTVGSVLGITLTPDVPVRRIINFQIRVKLIKNFEFR